MSGESLEMAGFERRTFESLRRVTKDGGEYWSARELYPVLEYSAWQKFEPVIHKAVTACENSGHVAGDHFTRTVKLIEAGTFRRRVFSRAFRRRAASVSPE
jgi:DNA-damage-inducible protein D